MKIKYLGTAAAEGVPALFCECDTCKKARKVGGKEIRTRSQALIDGKLMLDFPADTYFHSLIHGISLKDVHSYLITHTHSDHFYPKDFAMLGKGFANLKINTPPYRFYGGAEMVKEALKHTANVGDRIELYALEPFKTYEIDEYKVTPLKANHGTETPFIYIIKSKDKCMLYSHDTGLFTDETWDYLLKEKPYFNFISWDCCSGSKKNLDYTSHLCLGYIKDTVKRLNENGITDSKTKHCANHFSHNGPDILYENRAVYEREGYIMSYDGMEIEF
ncbi:MAG: hypothetical protein IJO62_01710 [Clostridia bacterium]|nr:hypothetical protein [Clostridia bacterium]